MKKQYGWMILNTYKSRGIKKQEPISTRLNPDGKQVLSGNMYIYPTRWCAKDHLDRLVSQNNFPNMKFSIIKVCVREVQKFK